MNDDPGGRVAQDWQRWKDFSNVLLRNDGAEIEVVGYTRITTAQLREIIDDLDDLAGHAPSNKRRRVGAWPAS